MGIAMAKIAAISVLCMCTKVLQTDLLVAYIKRFAKANGNPPLLDVIVSKSVFPLQTKSDHSCLSHAKPLLVLFFVVLLFVFVLPLCFFRQERRFRLR